jgi:hypothetical protein
MLFWHSVQLLVVRIYRLSKKLPRADPATGGTSAGSMRPSVIGRTDATCYSHVGGIWWRWPGSTRRPPACKAGALPTELHPRLFIPRPALKMVGQTGVEPVTSPLSGARSNHLSYWPTPVRSLAGSLSHRHPKEQKDRTVRNGRVPRGQVIDLSA